MWKNNDINGNNNGSKDDDKEKTMAKTAGFVVFSGIAMSILKTLNPFNNTVHTTTTTESISGSKIAESTQPHPPAPPTTALNCHTSLPSSQEPPISKKPNKWQEKTAVVESSPSEPSARTIEIAKGDTLWGLSRKYGVSIDAIKEANGLTGDTIYAGKKLTIP